MDIDNDRDLDLAMVDENADAVIVMVNRQTGPIPCDDFRYFHAECNEDGTFDLVLTLTNKSHNGKWARFYAVGTNRPIYGDRDGKVHYTLEEISAERRDGYAWQGDWGSSRLRRDHAELQSLGIQEFKSLRARNLRAARQTRGRDARARATEILADFAKHENRWIRGDRIHIADFVRNFNTLCDCLAFPAKQ